MAASPASQCRLEPINLHDPDQYAEVRRQRLLCGWDHEPATLEQWKLKQAEGLKSFFWITIPSSTAEEPAMRAGHISLDGYSEPPDPELSRTDKSILALQTFFVLPEYRALRLGGRAMELIEELALTEPYGSPGCKAIALTAISKRYMYEEGPDGRGLWERVGREIPPGSIEEWYEKRGYVTWKVEPRYEVETVDGGTVWLWEAYMRKVLR